MCIHRWKKEPFKLTARGVNSIEERRGGKCQEGSHQVFHINDIYHFKNYPKVDLVNICQAC